MKSKPLTTIRPVFLCLSIIIFSLSIFYSSSAAAKPDYVFFSINGDTTLAVMTQGDLFGWGSNCDSGATINWEIWYDLNNNSVVDPASDMIVSTENWTDGDPMSEESPVLDGWVISGEFNLGAADGQYIFRAKDIVTEVTVQRIVTVNAMVSPPNQFTGQISVPGYSPPNSILANRIVYCEADGVPGAFFAKTDINGQYAINIIAEGTGSDFYIGAQDFTGYVAPGDVIQTAAGVVSGVDFAYVAASDSVYGYVRDDMGTIVNFEGSVYMQQMVPPYTERDLSTVGGRYVLYFTSADSAEWQIDVNSGQYSPTFLSGSTLQFSRDTLNSFQHDFMLTRADAEIYARVTENGGPPSHQYLINAYSVTLFSGTSALSGIGTENLATLKVSTLDPSGWIVSINQFDDRFPIPPGYVPSNIGSSISPGDTVDLDLVSTSGCCVGDRGNANGDPEDKLNITDITYLIQYLFGVPSGPAPPCIEEGNANGDPEEKLNITDITYLIQYLFGVPTGPAPPACP